MEKATMSSNPRSGFFYSKGLISSLTVVEIEINTHCNRRCSHCPNSVMPLSSIPRYISGRLFRRILDELARIRFDGRISYHFYNEPLLREDMEELVRQTAHSLPEAHQALYTNGDFLSEKRYVALKKAGIAHFIVTRHDNTPVPERPLQTVLFPADLNLTNRGGILEKLPRATARLLSKPCYAPDEMLIITVAGDVLLCYEDAERKHVMGNIGKQSIENIWFSRQFVAIRQLLALGKRREAGFICKKCSNEAHIERGTSFFAL